MSVVPGQGRPVTLGVKLLPGLFLLLDRVFAQ
jgi:hypothetical protein